MAGFMYLVAGRNRVAVGDLAGIGLDYAFERSLSCIEVSAATLAKQPGCVIADPNLLPPQREVGYYPDEQTWRPMPRTDDGPPLYLGFWNADPPQPEELRRETPLRCHKVKLDDERMWDIPIVGHPESNRLQTDLPAWMDLDEEGRRVRGEVLADYRDLWQIVSEVADKQLSFDAGEDDAVPPTDDEHWRATIACLQAVYRVDICELVAMRVFIEGGDTLAWVWMVVANYQWLMKQLADNSKKKRVRDTGWTQFNSWRSGLAPNHSPSWAELQALSLGL